MKATCLTTDEIKAKLESSGIQPTAQRITVCQYVLCQADHPTAEQVKDWVDQNFPKMSLATVYNTLNTLVEAGLLRELSLAHSESKLYDANVLRHHHFLDEETGQVFDIPIEAVQVSPHLGRQYKISGIEVVIRGRKTAP